jgi:hypothetical protein
MNRPGRAFTGSIVASLLFELAACSKALPLPQTGPHVGEDPQIVPYPPPPARVEIVQARPEPDAVWVDGEWQWKGRRWIWQPGGWQIPYPGAYYAPSVTVRLADGQLAWFRGQWQLPEKEK